MSVESVTIRDAATGSQAKILPSLGFNCYEFRVASPDGPRDVLWSVADFGDGQQRPSSSGIPLLFPFPGRIPHGVLAWQGREFHLPARDGRGNAIHGFVYDRPWRVIEQTASRVVGQFQASVDDPAILELWPADFRITATYEVALNTLHCRYRIENPDTRPLPCGLGTHPYFTVPTGDAARECLVRLPVTQRWELQELLPTGRLLAVDDAPRFAAGLTLADMSFDDVFTGLHFEGDECRASIHSSPTGPTTTIRFDRTFRECVVYTPPHRQALCIEPYSCVPGAFSLQDKGHDTGLRILPPGATFDATVEIVHG